MSGRNAGLVADPLFVGATRPSMIWGVTYSAVMLNAMCVMELFLLTKNLLILLIAAPVHGVCMLLCAKDARLFDLTLLWGRTRLPALLGNLRFWKASSYSPLIIDLPNIRGARSRPLIYLRLLSLGPSKIVGATAARGRIRL
jgi:type IV secretion system protein VirB3